MSHQRSATHAKPIPPSALREGHLIGTLFQIRDEYIKAHYLVFGPIKRLQRFLGLEPTPSSRRVALGLEAQINVLDAATPRISSLTASPMLIQEITEYFQSLRKAIKTLHVLVEESSGRRRLCSAALRTYNSAADAFGRVAENARTRPLSRPHISFEGGSATRTSPPEAPLVTSDSTQSANLTGMRYFKGPIATTTQLGQALFEAAIMSPEEAGKVLRVARVPEEEIDRLEMEALYLSLFTVRLIFSNATNEGAHPESEVLAEFDRNVASYFAPEPQCAIHYEARTSAYSLALGPDTVLTSGLGREYSRLCGSSAVAEALGASLVNSLIKATKEAIGGYQNAQRSKVGKAAPFSAIYPAGRHPASHDSSTKVDGETLGAAIHALTYVLDVANPTAVVDVIAKAAPSLGRSRAHCELFCLRSFAALTVIRHNYEEPELELVTKAFYKEAHRIVELAGWRSHSIHVSFRGDSYFLAFTDPLAPMENESLARAFLVGSEFMRHCQSSDDSLIETGANAFMATISSSERFIEEFRNRSAGSVAGV